MYVCVCLCMGIPVLTVTFSEAHILTKEWILILDAVPEPCQMNG